MAVHGNYHGYYSKRPSATDARLAVLPKDTFAGRRVLDIGCNEGWITCEIAQSWGASRVIGVDIDDTLIRAAWKRRTTVWSLQSPEDDTPDYFPAAFEHTLGPLTIPPAGSSDRSKFPYNIVFRTADWTVKSIPEDGDGYDVIIAFSISKWIHLHGGDVGLEAFFQRVYASLRPGGSFILEPQAWDTYKKAQRLDSTLKENAKSLKHRPESFHILLEAIGFGPMQDMGTVGDGGFRRPVQMYKKL